MIEFIRAKKLIHSTSDGQYWFGVTHNTNIYRGCNQGCIYCDSRSSCYQIHDFDTVKAKENADILIDHELSSKHKKGIISMGGMSDPYNFLEKELKYTRNALKSMDKYGFGVSMITKSTLVTRDIDIYKNINTHSPVVISMTVTTASDKLAKRIERNVPSTSKRFEALKKMSDAGLFVGITLMPVLPFINDTTANIENILKLAKDNGVKFIYASFGVTLRDNQRQYFFTKIGDELTEKYVKYYGESYMCSSPNYDLLRKRFETLCDKYGILYKMDEIIKGAKNNVKTKQVALF